MMKLLPVVLLTAFVLAACATSPLGRQQLLLISEQQVDAMGIQAFTSMKQSKPIDSNAGDNSHVRCVAQTLVKPLGGQWDIVVFKDPSANAFALPGNKIGVHSGILRVARTQDQLATVVAHELAHVLSHHANERISQQTAVKQGLGLITALGQPSSPTGQLLMGALGLGAQYGILLPYSRTQESEADLYGLELMARAGFDPREGIRFWQNMEQSSGQQSPEFLSTHPSHATRISDIEKQLPKVVPLFEAAERAGARAHCGSGKGG